MDQFIPSSTRRRRKENRKSCKSSDSGFSIMWFFPLSSFLFFVLLSSYLFSPDLIRNLSSDSTTFTLLLFYPPSPIIIIVFNLFSGRQFLTLFFFQHIIMCDAASALLPIALLTSIQLIISANINVMLMTMIIIILMINSQYEEAKGKCPEKVFCYIRERDWCFKGLVNRLVRWTCFSTPSNITGIERESDRIEVTWDSGFVWRSPNDFISCCMIQSNHCDDPFYLSWPFFMWRSLSGGNKILSLSPFPFSWSTVWIPHIHSILITDSNEG